MGQKAAGYGRLHRYLHSYVGSTPALHALKPWFPSRLTLDEKLSTVSLESSIKVKRRDEERQRRESLTSIDLSSLHLHLHIHVHISQPSSFSFTSHPQTCPHARESSLNINTLPDSHTSLKNRLSSKTLENPKSLLRPPLPLSEEGGNPCQNGRTKANGRPVAVMKQGSKATKKMRMNGEMYSEEEARKDPRWLF